MIHNFTGGYDGSGPGRNMAVDASGNLYGTADNVFELKHSNSGWIFQMVYNFGVSQPNDGYDPNGVVIGPDGNLYGTTYYAEQTDVLLWWDGTQKSAVRACPSGSAKSMGIAYAGEKSPYHKQLRPRGLAKLLIPLANHLLRHTSTVI